MRRFYAPPEHFQGNGVILDPEETLHLARVLRLSVGAKVQVTDGQGGNFAAEVTSLDPRGAALRILGKLDSWGESPLPLVLGIGLAKADALDEAMRQATEMGVSRIFPFISERSERLTPERVARRVERWRRLARESIKSCQRSMLPVIEPPRDFAAALQGPEEVKLIFWEEERGGGLKSMLQLPRPQAVRVLIGPEGGFSPGEAALAREAGFQVVSLGPRRLKVPTAALAALTLIQYAWGDLA
jgi:16S rRNA (uracil1498-N3)-methyltransferase